MAKTFEQAVAAEMALVEEALAKKRFTPANNASRKKKAEPSTAKRNALVEEYASGRSPDLTTGVTIDPRRSPVTGSPSPRLGEDPMREVVGADFKGGLSSKGNFLSAAPVGGDRSTSSPMGNVSTAMGESGERPYRISAKDEEVVGANFKGGMSPKGKFLSAASVGGERSTSTPMGNVSTAMGESGERPYRISAKDEEVVGANFKGGMSPTGKFLNAAPVGGGKSTSAPMGNVSTAIGEAPVGPSRDIEAFFKTATGSSFNPKSRADVARKNELEAFLRSKPELAGKSNVQASLQWYRQMANAKRK